MIKHELRTWATPVVTFLIVISFGACREKSASELKIKQFDAARVASMAKEAEGLVTPVIDSGLVLKLWGIDSLIADPVSIDIDDQGGLYYTRTNRQKNSEFDIRGHQDWELRSIALQNIEDKRKFLRDELSPENSERNTWLNDLNEDGSHDWRDLTVEKEHVYRVEDTDGDGLADKTQLAVEDFHDEVTDAAGGVLKHGEDLFVAIGPDLWRTRDKDNDGLADDIKSLSHGYGIHIGFSGHGMSGVEVGPEGKIYWQIGDIGFSGVDQDGKKWEYPNSGVIVRANPDGSDFEVFAYGNRNTHEFVFDEYGNMISEDNDGDHAGESERLVYIVNGADIGWRSNWQYGKYRDPSNNTYKVWMDEKMYIPRWEGQPAYITPPIKNFVNGPTGMLYNPGTALSAAWKKTFFIVEFVGNPARSGIHAFKLVPKGATFELGEYKKVLGGVLATGIDFGPDGAMYVADWIDGWDTKDHGRVWKLDARDADTNERKETESLIKSDFTDLETDRLSVLLGHADMRVRQKAQFELANRRSEGLDALISATQQKDNQLSRVHGIWGISQFARRDIKHAQNLMSLLNDSDPEIRAQAARWIGDVRFAEAGDALIALLKDEYPRAKFFAAEALGRIAYEPAVEPIIDMLRANNDVDEYLRHAGSLALARIGKHAPIIKLSTDTSRAVRIAAVVALRRMQHQGIINFLGDSDEFVVTEAARAINDDLSIVEALPALAELLNKTPFTNEALIRRSINANLRGGTDVSMQALIDYSLNEKAPVAMRAEAIAALSTWAKPSVVDRVDGRYRGEVKRDIEPVRVQSSAALTQMLGHKDPTLRIAAAKAVSRLGIASSATALFNNVKSDKDANVKVESLKALATLGSDRTADAVKIALADKEKSVRVAGLALLTESNMPPEAMVSLLTQVISSRTMEEKQTAVITLGTLPVANTQAAFQEMIAKLKNGKLSPEIQLELAEAIDSTRSESLKSAYKDASKTLSADTLTAAYAGALSGGDANRGRRIFYRHQAAQCIRCHAYDDYGGNAGPRMNGIAKRLSRQELLESLVNPDARLAPGFGTLTLDLNSGKKVSGILQGEDAKMIKLKIGERDTVVMKSAVSSRVNAASSMPAMRYVLTKREIRDVVAFLATLDQEE
jgi:quinoprotein glucose dehydrogenase